MSPRWWCARTATHQVTLLFDPGTGLEERVLSEQFRY